MPPDDRTLTNATSARTKPRRRKQLLVLEELPNGTPCYQPLKLEIMEKISIALGEAAGFKQRAGRPYVTLSYAQSLDGSIAARPGRPLALSGSQSMALTHGLRAAHDGILVGIGTLLADNPRLNVRLVEGKDPQPIVVDSRLRFPPYANLLRNGRVPWIATSADADSERQAALEKIGARVLRLPAAVNGWVDLDAMLRHLGEMGLNSLMVEGGAQIITSFLAARLVDQVVLTIAPMLVGGLRVMDYLGQHQVNCFPRLRQVSYQRLGEDLVLRGEPHWESP
jgi:3,4-dihydroxy 2-butanone 4-phosphate synthase/GTP cyclohydrolase II